MLAVQNMMEHWEVNAYISNPALVQFTDSPTLIAYEKAAENVTDWEKWWMGRRLAGWHTRHRIHN